MIREKLRFAIRFVAGLATSGLLFFVINARKSTLQCFDCPVSRGWPFALYQEAGRARGGGVALMWPGIVGDLGLVLIAALLIAWGLGKALRREEGR